MSYAKYRELRITDPQTPLTPLLKPWVACADWSPLQFPSTDQYFACVLARTLLSADVCTLGDLRARTTLPVVPAAIPFARAITVWLGRLRDGHALYLPSVPTRPEESLAILEARHDAERLRANAEAALAAAAKAQKERRAVQLHNRVTRRLVRLDAQRARLKQAAYQVARVTSGDWYYPDDPPWYLGDEGIDDAVVGQAENEYAFGERCGFDPTFRR